MKPTTPESKFLPATLTGIAITIAAGAILFPIIYFTFTSLFELHVFTDPPPNAWIKDTFLISILYVWPFVATAAGGWACAGASKHNEYSHALFLAVLWTVIVTLLYLYSANNEPLTNLLLIIVLGVAGYFAGTALRMRKKRKVHPIVK